MGEQAKGGLPEEEQLELKADEWSHVDQGAGLRTSRNGNGNNVLGAICYRLSVMCQRVY